MDALCISLVHQYLDNTKSALADQFKYEYQPQKTNVELKEVLSKWKEEQLVRGLIYQHLKTVAPSLAGEFRDRHWCSLEPAPKRLLEELQKKLLEIASKRGISKVEDESRRDQEQENKRMENTLTTEEQLVKSLVYQHLRKVAPSLAVEFRDNHLCCSETAPGHLLGELQGKVLAIARSKGTYKVDAESKGKPEQNNNRKRLERNTFTSEELDRIKKAMANNEDMGTVAKEMGRSYNSVSCMIYYLRKSAGLKKGKFSAEEIERVKQAVANNEDYKSVAAELNRNPKSVHSRLLSLTMKGNLETVGRGKNFAFEEDLCILDKAIDRLSLKFSKLSSAGILSQSDFVELAKDLHRYEHTSVRKRWETMLQPWLLQHYTGTTGFRIERMLTSLVAEKFNDHKGIDWSEILNQHKELVGHTASSISGIYRNILSNAKEKKSDVSLQEVAEYAATVYQPGKEKKEPAAKAFHREKIVSYFKEKVAELGINVVV